MVEQIDLLGNIAVFKYKLRFVGAKSWWLSLAGSRMEQHEPSEIPSVVYSKSIDKVRGAGSNCHLIQGNEGMG